MKLVNKAKSTNKLPKVSARISVQAQESVIPDLEVSVLSRQSTVEELDDLLQMVSDWSDLDNWTK
eukprot:EST48855.1 Hypothetical protein SS50377_10953 [Spironucleus salmonicida]